MYNIVNLHVHTQKNHPTHASPHIRAYSSLLLSAHPPVPLQLTPNVLLFCCPHEPPNVMYLLAEVLDILHTN